MTLGDDRILGVEGVGFAVAVAVFAVGYPRARHELRDALRTYGAYRFGIPS